MKKLAIMIGVIMTVSGALMASELETSRMESGMKFAEQQTDKKFDSGSSAIEINELSEVEEAECNAEAKDYTKLSVKTPPALKTLSSKDVKKGHTAEIVGAGVGGAAVGGAALYAGVVSVAMSGGAVAAAPIVVAAAVGAGIGYGVVAGCKWIYNHVHISVKN